MLSLMLLTDYLASTRTCNNRVGSETTLSSLRVTERRPLKPQLPLAMLGLQTIPPMMICMLEADTLLEGPMNCMRFPHGRELHLPICCVISIPSIIPVRIVVPGFPIQITTFRGSPK